MGLQNFNKFIQEKSPDATRKIPLKQLNGERIAIDGYNIAYKYMAVAQKQEVTRLNILNDELDHDKVSKNFINNILNLIKKFLAHGITPVFVLDGAVNPLKIDTRNKRKEDKEKSREAYEQAMNIIKQTEKLYITQEMIKNAKKELYKLISLLPEDIDILKNLLSGFGIPCITARHDGEKLCANLCNSGYVYAVYSTDADTYAFGSLRIMNNIESVMTDFGLTEIHVSITETSKILTSLSITLDQLIDMFILIGSDYNDGIKGVGLKTAYSMIKKYGSIDNLGWKYDINSLNYMNCRDEFKIEPVDPEYLNLDQQLSFLIQYGREISSQYDMSHHMDEFLLHTQNLPKPRNRSPSKPMILPQFTFTNPNPNNNVLYNTTQSTQIPRFNIIPFGKN